MPQARLGAGSWQLEGDALSALRAKLSLGRKTLKEVYGSPLYGIKTGLNDAFIVNRATHDALVRDDPKSADLLKPFLVGEDLQKWRIESEDRWIIYIPKNSVNVDEYPAIRDHLTAFRKELEGRATKQAWFELQQAQADYVTDFAGRKLLYPEISQGAKFAIDESGYFPLNKLFYINSDSFGLSAFLNSTLNWAYLFGICSPLRGGQWRLELRAQYVETIPIPDGLVANADLVRLGRVCQTAASERHSLSRSVGHEILRDLAPGGLTSKLPGVLRDWPSLDFAAFRSAVKKHFKRDIPQAERNDWEAKLIAGAKRVAELTAEIRAAEREIDQIVHHLFDLTPDEVALIEASVAQ